MCLYVMIIKHMLKLNLFLSTVDNFYERNLTDFSKNPVELLNSVVL